MIFIPCTVISYIVFSFFGDTAPFDDWEGEAFADISELLNPLPDVPSAAGHQTHGASAQDQTSLAPPLEEPLGIQDFDLDLLDGRSSSPKPDLSDLLLDPLEAVSSALRNDVMLTTGQQANVTGGHRHNHYHQPLGNGFLPKEESLLHTHNRCGSYSMSPVWLCYIQCWGSGSACFCVSGIRI
jgi:hypothetical protein